VLYVCVPVENFVVISLPSRKWKDFKGICRR